MSEEECKTKEDISTKITSQREINSLIESKHKTQKDSINITINDINNKNNIIYTYGNYQIFKYDKNGDPLFLIGPDYSYFICLFILSLVYFIFLAGLYIALTNFIVSFFGIILNLIQFFFFMVCGMKNPGLPKRELQDENLIMKNPSQYQRCPKCNFIIDKSKHYRHCDTCACCCEGYDHHCPWTSKCVGKGNIFYFNGMLFMICIVFIYVVVAIICMEPKRK